MSSDRKQPGLAFGATVVVVVALVAYPLSFGPACWLVDRGYMPARTVAKAFRPVLQFPGNSWQWSAATWYAGIGATDPPLTMMRIVDAAGMIIAKSGQPFDMRHDEPWPSSRF
jgi:hypothetical protein